MADKEENPKLEGLLRRWGAQEAAGQAAVRPLAMQHADGATPAKEFAPGTNARPRLTWAGFVARWAPLAAAAMFIAASGIIVWHYRQKVQMYEAQLQKTRAAESAVNASADKSRQSLQKALGELAEAREAARATSQTKDALAAKMQKDIGDLQARYDEAAGKLLAANDRLETDLKEIARLTAVVNDKSATQELNAQLAQAKKDLEASQAEAKAARSQLADASGDLGTARQQQAKAQGDYQRRLDAAAAGMTASLDRLGASYLKAASPGQTELVARQQASKRLMLVDRLAKLRHEVKNPQTRSLLDQIETALTRLEMLDASSPSSLRAYATTVGQELPARLDRALLEGGENEQVVALLLDARIVIGGLGNVG
jgi:chromosome segregation ATPase